MLKLRVEIAAAAVTAQAVVVAGTTRAVVDVQVEFERGVFFGQVQAVDGEGGSDVFIGVRQLEVDAAAVLVEVEELELASVQRAILEDAAAHLGHKTEDAQTVLRGVGQAIEPVAIEQKLARFRGLHLRTRAAMRATAAGGADERSDGQRGGQQRGQQRRANRGPRRRRGHRDGTWRRHSRSVSGRAQGGGVRRDMRASHAARVLRTRTPLSTLRRVCDFES